MVDMNTELFKTLRGKREDSIEIKNYLESLNESPLINDYEDGDRYYNFSETGMNVIFEKGGLHTLQLFANGVEENTSCYQGQLPHSLNFSDSREIVFEKLGSPDKFREGLDDPRPFVFMYPWCKYFFDGYSLHITFEMDNSKIRMVALA